MVLTEDVALKILSALRYTSDGMTRTEIRKLVGGRVTKDRIELALYRLAEYDFVRRTVETETGGRPTERWFLQP